MGEKLLWTIFDSLQNGFKWIISNTYQTTLFVNLPSFLMICMMPLVHWKVGVYIGCLVLLDTNDCYSNGYSLYYAHDWFVSTCLWARFFVINRNRNVPQSNQLHSLLYRLCSVITRNIEINKRGKSTKNFTTSFFKNITAVCPLYSASHSVESELEDFLPLFPICGQ